MHKFEVSTKKEFIQILALVLLVFQFGIGVFSQQRKSIYFDEPEHIRAGMQIWKQQDYTYEIANPPLPKRLIALPQMLLDQDSTRLQIGLARMPVFLMRFILGWVLFAWTCTRVGSRGALVALALYCFCPNLLAHGSIAGPPDMMAAAGFFISLISCIALIHQITWFRLFKAGVSLGVLFSTKFTAFLILPPLIVLSVFCILMPWRLRLFNYSLTQLWQKSLVLIGVMLILGGFAVSVIWGSHGFQFKAGPDDTISDLLLDKFGKTPDILIHVLQWLGTHKLLPEAYLKGIIVMLIVENPGYLRGETSFEGWWWYFPYALLVKTPIPTLLFFFFGFGAAAIQLRKLWQKPSANIPPNLLEWMGLMLFIVFYFGTLMTSSYNVGIRHLLPVYPCWMVLAALINLYLKRSKILCVVTVLLLLWLGVTFVCQSPDYLAYFNEFIGGSRNGYKHLVDSNLDWGQDLPLLAQYLASQGNPEIFLQYFGSASPHSYGIHSRPIVMLYGYPRATDVLLPPLSAGLYVISISHLFGGYIPDVPSAEWVTLHRKINLYNKALQDSKSHHLYDKTYENPPTRKELILLRRFQGLALLKRLKQLEPNDRIGYTMFVYQLTNKQLTNWTLP